MTTVRPRIAFERVVADDPAALDVCFALDIAVCAADRPDDPPPCVRDHHASLAMPWPGSHDTVWLARCDGEVVGNVLLSLTMRDNLDNAFGEVQVAPGRRRGGIGTVLLEHLVTEARAAGRIRLIAQVPELPTAGPAFAVRAEALRALAEQRRRLTLPPDEATLATLAAQARAAAAGYELVQWTGDTPAVHVDDLAYLTGRMSVDAPLDDLHIEPHRYDAERIRARDAAQTARGHRITVTGAVHTASRRLVAFTDVAVHATVPTHAYQRDTLVAPEHRGHRLGMLTKLANLALLRREHPDVREITTWNADSNPYMVSINEAMGFRPLDHWGEWELDLTR